MGNLVMKPAPLYSTSTDMIGSGVDDAGHSV